MSGITYMPVGSAWGHLAIIRAYKAALTDGAVTDLHGGPLTWVLRCDCGRKFAIEAAAFPGKRKLRSCGDPECEWGKVQPKRRPGRIMGRPRNTEVCAAFSLYMPVAVIGLVEAYAKRKAVSVGVAAAELVKAGWGAVEEGAGTVEGKKYLERLFADRNTEEAEGEAHAAQETAAWDANTGMRGPQVP